jgi:hypothetical protein
VCFQDFVSHRLEVMPKNDTRVFVIIGDEDGLLSFGGFI